jgi:transposase
VDIINYNKGIVAKREGVYACKKPQALPLADDTIAERTALSRRGLEQMRRRFVEEGFETTLEGKPKGRRPKALNGEDEARLVALVCGPKPDGRTRWTLRLLAEKRTTLANADTKSICYETVGRTLKKTNLSLGGARNGVFRPRATSSL